MEGVELHFLNSRLENRKKVVNEQLIARLGGMCQSTASLVPDKDERARLNFSGNDAHDTHIGTIHRRNITPSVPLATP